MSQAGFVRLRMVLKETKNFQRHLMVVSLCHCPGTAELSGFAFFLEKKIKKKRRKGIMGAMPP
jgi:hypothetical protein